MTETSFELHDKGMVVGLPEGQRYFNYYWLRDACQSCIDPQTRERVFDASELAQPPRATSAMVEGEVVVIGWADEAQASRVPLALLRDVAANGRGADPADLPRRLWFNDHLPRIARVSQDDVTGTEEGRARLARALIEDGIAIVTGMEKSEGSLPRLVNAIGPVTPSAEGLFFNVRVEIAPTNLAFTAGPLEMHTDLPGEETAPGVQFLHCLENTVEGGNSLFLDGAAVAEALREEDPEAFALLAGHDIPFFYRHDDWDYRAHQRVIETDVDGRVTGVTISQHLQDNMDLPQDLLDDYYPAFVKFIRMMKEDRFLLRFRSEAGNCVVFDNHRIVHGREGYVADSGSRHLRGCYTDRGALRSTYRVLAKKGFDGEAEIPARQAQG
ncbi:TauD/TfdA family dioxygenase [Paracoccus sp. 1_MG-2023]|uniref:TauD/TfdA family dioxygenase n=1 Tax=unclassified Paracoccus (in: a-proteobacteria) TaxID=2688777 RepID=UPI001C09181B|nr:MULTISPECIES: TauD/TfdA family dioxygenase [unclassified Paracoccus (in: a-proteobacteria)]MBU2957826.1 TauD/TfdA family dioxygenase [Paracoccus sp. C2R09]MDO6667326.1 TauD/TfdA family dioxygenase [Paracoccus sp. 1_MG-2023]